MTHPTNSAKQSPALAGSWLIVFFFVLFCLLGLAEARQDETVFPRSFKRFSYDGKTAFPPLKLRDLQDRPVNFRESYAGRYVLVNIWATWCAPCLSELPSLETLEKERGGETFSVILVSADMPANAETLKTLMESKGLSGQKTLYMSDVSQWDLVASEGLPVSYLVAPNGTIIYRILGDGDWDSDAAYRFFDRILKL